DDWTFASTYTTLYQVFNQSGYVAITRLDQNSSYTEGWALLQSGGTTTLNKGDGLHVVTATSSGTSPRTESVTVADSTSTAETKQRVYQTFPWGEELVSETLDPAGLALTTTYAYYNTTLGDGHYSKLKSVARPDGSWTVYDYYDDFARWGELAGTYQPWQDAPTDPATATTTNCKYTSYSYLGRRSVYQELPGSIQTSVNGTAVAKTTISSSFAATSDYNLSPIGNQPLRTDTVQAFSAASASQTTVTTSFDATADPTYAGKLYSQVNPDGTKVSASYQTVSSLDYNGTASGAWSSIAIVPNSGGANWCDTYLYGTAAQGDPTASQQTTDGMSGGKPVSPIWMTPNRSYRRQVYHDTAGNPVFDMTQVWTGSAYQIISWQQCTFTPDGLPLTCQKSDGELTTYTYQAGKILTQINPDGTQISNTYDALLRATKTAKIAAPAYLSYGSQPEIDTTFTYDAAGHVLTSSTSGGGLSLTATTVYNQAGLPTSQTDATGLTSTVSYANGGRTVTSTLANGGTQIVDSRIDGTQKSVTGTGVIAQYYGCSVNSDGTITCQTNVGTSTSSRASTTTTDWLGRTITQTGPAFGGGTVTAQAFYNSSGQLTKTTQTGVAPTLYQYDGLGDLQYTGLDVNNNGTLDL